MCSCFTPHPVASHEPHVFDVTWSHALGCARNVHSTERVLSDLMAYRSVRRRKSSGDGHLCGHYRLMFGYMVPPMGSACGSPCRAAPRVFTSHLSYVEHTDLNHSHERLFNSIEHLFTRAIKEAVMVKSLNGMF